MQSSDIILWLQTFCASCRPIISQKCWFCAFQCRYCDKTDRSWISVTKWRLILFFIHIFCLVDVTYVVNCMKFMKKCKNSFERPLYSPPTWTWHRTESASMAALRPWRPLPRARPTAWLRALAVRAVAGWPPAAAPCRKAPRSSASRDCCCPQGTPIGNACTQTMRHS